LLLDLLTLYLLSHATIGLPYRLFRQVLSFGAHLQVLAHPILLIDWTYSIIKIALTLHGPRLRLLPHRLDEILFVNKVS
jgi:hypothetical protein